MRRRKFNENDKQEPTRQEPLKFRIEEKGIRCHKRSVLSRKRSTDATKSRDAAGEIKRSKGHQLKKGKEQKVYTCSSCYKHGAECDKFKSSKNQVWKVQKSEDDQ